MSQYNMGWKKQGWIEESLDKKVNRNMMKISSILQRVSRENIKNEKLDIFQEIIKRIFKVIGKDTGIFATKRPVKILNNTPFVINKVEEYPDIVFKHFF